VSNNVAADRLEIMPAYWWLYNMYALARNTWKYHTRDKRKTKVQNIEFDTFAPDTMQEVMHARHLLEQWTGKAYIHENEGQNNNEDLRTFGRRLLQGDRKVVDKLTILGEGMENSRRPVHILKVYDAYHAYGDMLIHYAMGNVLDYFDNCAPQREEFTNLTSDYQPHDVWINLGGQLVKETDLDTLRRDICNGTLYSWDDIHHRYDELWTRYATDKLCHALQALCHTLGTDTMTSDLWLQALAHEERIQRRISEQVYLSRKKDYDNPFRTTTCRNAEETLAVYGTSEENSFVSQVREEMFANIKRIERLRNLFTP
jgi:hypothetical protein